MNLLQRLKPGFLDHHDSSSGLYKSLFNFKQLWKQSIAILLVVVLTPLLALAFIDYRISKKAVESEILLRTSRVVSNARRTLNAYLDERQFALRFLLLDNTDSQLRQPGRLQQILSKLKSGLGEWNDLGLIDQHGVQVNYAGPYPLQGKEYGGQPWYLQLQAEAAKQQDEEAAITPIVSDVFLGYRQNPHLVIAALTHNALGEQVVLRASLDIERLNRLLADLEMDGNGDAFLINQQGVLQTSSKYYGQALSRLPFTVPPPAERSQVLEGQDHQGRHIVIGYAYITGTPFILLVVKQKQSLMRSWDTAFTQLLIFLLASMCAIIAVVFGMSTYLVNSIYQADQKRLVSLHQVEYANKMASIGRLSAGVAHEINNPLAIINEKAGLIKDLFTFRKEYAADARLISLIDAIINSVERCATITRRMLNFARNSQVAAQRIKLRQVIDDVLEFQRKEASYRGIAIDIDLAEDLPEFFVDRGKLQQIFINLVNNAFAAMQEGGGKLEFLGRLSEDRSSVIIRVSDTGCGISTENVKKIFEPFFTTKSGSGGTGLGLSITYSLVQEIGGEIQVDSAVGQGTAFTITLPLRQSMEDQGGSDARAFS